jgi:hypothetical protein
MCVLVTAPSCVVIYARKKNKMASFVIFDYGQKPGPQQWMFRKNTHFRLYSQDTQGSKHPSKKLMYQAIGLMCPQFSFFRG